MGHAHILQVLQFANQVQIAVRERLDAVHRQEFLIIQRVQRHPVRILLANKLAVVLDPPVRPRVVTPRRQGQRQTAKHLHLDACAQLFGLGRQYRNRIPWQFRWQTEMGRPACRQIGHRILVIDIHQRANAVGFVL